MFIVNQCSKCIILKGYQQSWKRPRIHLQTQSREIRLKERLCGPNKQHFRVLEIKYLRARFYLQSLRNEFINPYNTLHIIITT